MATRRTEPVAAEVSDAVETGLPEQDALMGMMAELAGSSNAKITVYRTNQNGPLSYVFACAPEAFSLDDLRDKYNGGTFRLFISKNGKLWKNQVVAVEPKVQALADSVPPPSGFSEIAALLRESQEKQMALILAMQNRPAPPAPTIASMLGGLDLPAVITAVTAAIQVLRPPPVAAAAAGANEAINLLMKGFEIAKEMRESAGDGGGDSLIGVLRDMVKSPMLAAAVQAAALPPPAPVSHAKPTPRPPPPPSLPRPPAPSAPTNQPAIMETPIEPAASPAGAIQQYMAVLTTKAAGGADPTLYAEMVLDNLDDETIIGLLGRQPNAVDALLLDYPPAAAHREWFEAMIATIAAAFEDDESDVQQSPLSDGADDALGHSA